MGRSDCDKLWSAPEILKQEKKVDMQLCDIYSFGIIAHEILNQRGTFYISNNEIMSYYKVTDGPYPSMFNKPEMAHFVINALKDKNRDTIRPSFISDPNEEPVMLILREMLYSQFDSIPT
uniref:Serine-threonine/tyrosine-protein kinase catalytic domain-containing protein n=1 Tax=Romanomermis culicivorax TaxID=13658 RepID=A0A915HX72_ROMCU